MKLSIVMPTMIARLGELRKTKRVYRALTPKAVKIEWITLTGYDNCGQAWNDGVAQAKGDIVHMGADDIQPESELWFPAAMAAIDQGHVPLGLVREDEAGTFGRDFCRVVICRREWWQPVPAIHYYSDNAFTELMKRGGHEPQIVDDFDFYHRRSLAGRDDSPPRVQRDAAHYAAWLDGQ